MLLTENAVPCRLGYELGALLKLVLFEVLCGKFPHLRLYGGTMLIYINMKRRRLLQELLRRCVPKPSSPYERIRLRLLALRPMLRVLLFPAGLLLGVRVAKQIRTSRRSRWRLRRLPRLVLAMALLLRLHLSVFCRW